MSALGDYVHYAVKNYQRYGISYKGNTSNHYNGTIDNYIIQKKNIGKYNNTFNYNKLEQELRKNSIDSILKDQQLVNLDYGQKINQFKSMILAKAMGEQNIHFKNNLSNKTEAQLLNEKKEFDNLQREISYYNEKLLSGETIFPSILEEITNKYNSLSSEGTRTSILGNIQQGLNDNAANVWQDMLNGEFGKQIDISINKSAKASLESEIKSSIQSIPGLYSNLTIEDDKTSYKTIDKLGSQYSIESTKEGWELNFKGKRKNILSGSVKNIYADDPGYGLFRLNGETNLGTVLSMLEAENNFGTHWMNMHACYLDNSLDNDLRIAIIYEGLSNSHSEISRSGDFVYIDRTIGQIEHMNFWSAVDMTNFRISPDITGKRLDNTWMPPKNPSKSGAYLRIANLLQEVHATNLYIASESISI